MPTVLYTSAALVGSRRYRTEPSRSIIRPSFDGTSAVSFNSNVRIDILWTRVKGTMR